MRLNSVFWLQFLFGASDWVLQSGVSRVLDGDMLCQFLELTSMQQESVLSEPQGIASVGFSAATSLSSLSSSSSSSLSASGRSLSVDRVLRLLERIHNSLAWNVERKENHSTSSLHHAIWKLSETEIITKLPLILALSLSRRPDLYTVPDNNLLYIYSWARESIARWVIELLQIFLTCIFLIEQWHSIQERGVCGIQVLHITLYLICSFICMWTRKRCWEHIFNPVCIEVRKFSNPMSAKKKFGCLLTKQIRFDQQQTARIGSSLSWTTQTRSSCPWMTQTRSIYFHMAKIKSRCLGMAYTKSSHLGMAKIKSTCWQQERDRETNQNPKSKKLQSWRTFGTWFCSRVDMHQHCNVPVGAQVKRFGIKLETS